MQGRLSPREKDCLQRLLAGKVNKEIAADLGISVNVAKNYLRSAYQKLGINNSRELFPLVIMANREVQAEGAAREICDSFPPEAPRMQMEFMAQIILKHLGSDPKAVSA